MEEDCDCVYSDKKGVSAEWLGIIFSGLEEDWCSEAGFARGCGSVGKLVWRYAA